MIGSIIGDIVGSVYEFDNYRKKDFVLFGKDACVTDDSIMTISIAKALLEVKGNYDLLKDETIKWMQIIGRKYPYCGYGNRFYNWIFTNNPLPYNSFGNGSAMRIGGVGWICNNIEEVKQISKIVTEISHNHPEGIKGAEAVAVAIYLARNKKTKKEIKDYIETNYYKLNFTIDEIRPTYMFNETCQKTVPEALEVFFESENFEDAIRLAVSLGGDSDTIGCIVGSISEAYYGVPNEIREKALSYLDVDLKRILLEFENIYGPFYNK